MKIHRKDKDIGMSEQMRQIIEDQKRAIISNLETQIQISEFQQRQQRGQTIDVNAEQAKSVSQAINVKEKLYNNI